MFDCSVCTITVYNSNAALNGYLPNNKSHTIGDQVESQHIQIFHRRAQILRKKTEGSLGENKMFAEELGEIEEQLKVSNFNVLISVE